MPSVKKRYIKYGMSKSVAYNFESMSDEEILEIPLCALGLKIEGSSLEPLIARLFAELAAKKLYFKPHLWLSTEWFSPYGIPGFAIPFYLVHPRLIELEKRFMNEAEGERDLHCLQLLRHECGHAIDNAFHLRKSKTRQALFGLSGAPYPKRYLPNPSSTKYVRHLKNGYAQAHPDEDWAESFAVWLDPVSNWQQRYRAGTVRKKLDKVDELMSKIAGQEPLIKRRYDLDSIESCQLTLAEYFLEKRKRFKLNREIRLPPIVKQRLTHSSQSHAFVPAALYLKSNRKELCNKITTQVKCENYIVKKAYNEIMQAALHRQDLGLNASCRSSKQELLTGLTLHVERYVKNRHHWISM